jgi:hypothetical protein
MRLATLSRRRALFLLVACGLFAAISYWVLAAARPAVQQEEMTLNDVPVVVEYATSVSARDLMLPFYRGAELEHGFAYTVKTKKGNAVTYYASAVLETPDSPEKVADAYRADLPGRPEPEVIEDQSGKRYVLAVAGNDEVRQVTITPSESGSRIELIRATRPVMPSPPLVPRTPRETPV